jgi:hypothetical protein
MDYCEMIERARDLDRIRLAYQIAGAIRRQDVFEAIKAIRQHEEFVKPHHAHTNSRDSIFINKTGQRIAADLKNE